MEKKIGETFKYNGVTLITIEDKNNDGCKECYFLNGSICTVCNNSEIFCTASWRDDNKSVIFKEVEDMETRTIKLTLEKAKEFYKKGGEFRDLALSAFTEEELTKVELPKTWEEFCSKYGVQNEYYIGSTIKRAHLALIKLHQLRDCYRQDWEPNWLDDENKYCIVYNSVYNYSISINKSTRVFLSFQSREVAQLFLDNFRNLIEEAGDLI